MLGMLCRLILCLIPTVCGMFQLFPGYDETPMTELAMQLPMYYFAVPYALDWNSDGVLDLWHHNHYVFSKDAHRWSDPSTKKLGPKKEKGGCMVDWDAILRHPNGTYYAANNGNGFIEWTDTNTKSRCFDVHSTAYLDIDGDGLKDLFLITGGGRGQGQSSDYDNLVFWGERANTSLGFRLVGGRDAAAKAGLKGRRNNMGNDRGRGQQWLDANGDGKLDIVLFNDERADDTIMPGNLMKNVGGRKFKRIKPGPRGFAEFSTMSLLTDVDGDGYAREFVVPSECEKRTKSKDSPPQNYVCKRAPRGSISVYQRDTERLLNRKSIALPSSETNGIPVTLGSGDFDGDALPDVAILWKDSVTFYLSKQRMARCEALVGTKNRRTCKLTLETADLTLPLGCSEEGASGMRFADFNLDGRLDMLIICNEVGKHSIYELLPDHKWRLMKASRANKKRGDALNDPSLMKGGKDFCKGIPITQDKNPTGPCKMYFNQERCKNVKYTVQFLICNRRARSQGKPIEVALGASVADIDNDGFQDLIVGYRFGSAVMLRNTLGDTLTRRFFPIRLHRDANPAFWVGATVSVVSSHMGPYANETTTQLRVVSTLSHETDAEGGRDDRLIFGLAKKGKILKVTVTWPNCCEKTELNGKKDRLWKWYDSMANPYEVSPPSICTSRCFNPKAGFPIYK